jgi:ABC-2 type transport system ATP-binding protein
MRIILSGGREPVAEGYPDFEPLRGSSRMGESVVSVRGLTKHFGDICALDGVNLEVKPGIFGFIGPNGAGKTTLLRILLGLLRPDSGNARILGHDVIHESLEVRKKVGVLHEKAFFPPSMTPSNYLKAVSQ